MGHEGFGIRSNVGGFFFTEEGVCGRQNDLN